MSVVIIHPALSLAAWDAGGWSNAFMSSGIAAEEFDALFPGCVCMGGRKHLSCFGAGPKA